MGALLSQFMNKYPYTDFHELNADWMIRTMMELINQVENFVSLNAIKYADPIQWNIIRQYEKNTIVIDPLSGTAYISVKPVPMGVALTNTDYWTVVFDLGSFVVRAAKNFTNRYEADTTLTATFPSSQGNWLVWGDVLYEVIIPTINAGDQYVVNSNIRHITMEEICDALAQAINDVDTKVGDLNDLTTSVTTSVVLAINSVLNDLNTTIGDIADLITTDKSSVVNAINENTEKINSFRMINVLQHGVKGDSQTDDTLAIQAIFDNLNDGDCVYFPEGTYIISDTVTIGDINDLYVTGDGFNSIIRYTGVDTTKNLIEIGTGAGFKHLRFENFAFYSNTNMTAGSALCINKPQEGNYINNIKFNDLADYNLYDCLELIDFNVIHVSGINASHAHDVFLLYGSSNDFYLDRSFISYSHGASIHAAGGVGGVYLTNTLVWSPNYGMIIDQAKSSAGNREFFISDTFVMDAIVTTGISIDAPNSIACSINCQGFISGAGHFAATPYCNNIWINSFPSGVFDMIGGVLNAATAFGLYCLDSTCKVILNGTRITENNGGGVYSNSNNVKLLNITYSSLNNPSAVLCNGSVLPYYANEIDVTNDQNYTYSKLEYFARDGVVYWSLHLNVTSAAEYIHVDLPFTPKNTNYYYGVLDSSIVTANCLSYVLIIHTDNTSTGNLFISGVSTLE